MFHGRGSSSGKTGYVRALFVVAVVVVVESGLVVVGVVEIGLVVVADAESGLVVVVVESGLVLLVVVVSAVVEFGDEIAVDIVVVEMVADVWGEKHRYVRTTFVQMFEMALLCLWGHHPLVGRSCSPPFPLSL